VDTAVFVGVDAWVTAAVDLVVDVVVFVVVDTCVTGADVDFTVFGSDTTAGASGAEGGGDIVADDTALALAGGTVCVFTVDVVTVVAVFAGASMAEVTLVAAEGAVCVLTVEVVTVVAVFAGASAADVVLLVVDVVVVLGAATFAGAGVTALSAG
jgi:hypothetical protein